MRRIISAAALALIGMALVPPGAGTSAQTSSGHPACFWFHSQQISDAGHGNYGTYAYRHLLPGFAPPRRGTGHFAFFDGDFLPQVQFEIPHQPGEEAVAARARPLGALAYVIAVYAYQSPAPFRDVDAALRGNRVTGYLGLTTKPAMPVQEFINLTRAMSLPVAMKQEGATLRIVSFAFLSEPDLKKLGYQPLYVSR